VRVSTEGRLFTCLFATEGHDLRALMRGGCTDDDLTAALGQIWGARTDRYSDLRGALNTELQSGQLRRSGKKRIEMSYIGG
jgi:cyclic pyranopterin phosphate synthase